MKLITIYNKVIYLFFLLKIENERNESMNYIELKVNGKRINLYGTKAIIEKEKNIIEQLNLSGNEQKDRLIIQKCIDENKLKSDILYDGNTVYPFEKTIKAYRKMQKTDSLENMSNYMYHFFTNACGDIAHYDIQGFRGYYNYSLRNLENILLKNNNFIPSWNTDVDKIFKELKIGEYFKDREKINIDCISINKLKSIIKDYGWNITIQNNSWKLDKEVLFSYIFSFEIDTSNRSISSIVNEIISYKNNFNKNEYMEFLIENRDTNENKLSVRDVVLIADNIESNLSKLSENVLYDCRLEVEENKKYNTPNFDLQQNDYEIEMCG